jgi:hypothetical protein
MIINIIIYSLRKFIILQQRQSKENSSRCSIVGINGKIDPLSEYDEVDEEVIYSQESPHMVEFYRDFDWELDRFVEYRLTIKKPL